MRGVDSKEVIFTFNTPLGDIPSPLADLQASLREGKLLVKYQPSHAAMNDILVRIAAAGLIIADISTNEVELEDLFIALTSAA
jgi:ABC-2 type transport system ATP-binding protein